LGTEKANTNLEKWVNDQLSKGKFSFSLDTLRKAFPKQTAVAIKSSLLRLAAKGNILSIHKGYYLIIPPQYKTKGILPPVFYLDSLMKELKRPYYLALLNAAAYHGASHQQPQEFFVVTGFPVLRPTIKKGLKINYISKNEIPETLLEKQKTEAGYVNMSNPILTATDLVQYAKRVGGITRVAELLNELGEEIKPTDFSAELIEYVPASVLQRLGYLLDKILHNDSLANALEKVIQQKEITLFRTPLKASASIKGMPVDERWSIIVNTQIELNE
jgi:predicted transcriptional regulator of viral defense system